MFRSVRTNHSHADRSWTSQREVRGKEWGNFRAGALWVEVVKIVEEWRDRMGKRKNVYQERVKLDQLFERAIVMTTEAVSNKKRWEVKCHRRGSKWWGNKLCTAVKGWWVIGCLHSLQAVCWSQQWHSSHPLKHILSPKTTGRQYLKKYCWVK